MDTIQFAGAAQLPIEYLDEIEKDPNKVVSEKFNGFREAWIIKESGNDLINRSGVSHMHTVPHFQQDIPELYGTILDCEGMSRAGKGSKYAKSIFGSGTEHALEYQRRYGLGTLTIFDILRFEGQDVTGYRLKDRRLLLMDVYRSLIKNWSEDIRLNVFLESFIETNKRSYFEMVVKEGGEGVMIKDLTALYIPGASDAWIKIKKVVTMDYIITGFTPGNGKYADAIGAVIYGKKNADGVIVPIGKSSGMTDVVRYHMAQYPEMYIGKLAEFGGKDINPETGTLIHPTFVRLRDDIRIE